MTGNPVTLSALVVVHNEEARIAACLERLDFADEIVVVLDKCTDRTREIAAVYTHRFVEGAWDLEGGRRNAGINACRSDWVLEVDADEHVPKALAAEIRQVIGTTQADWHEILVDNYIGDRLVRWGWGASYGKAAYPGLFKRGVKRWGMQRVHPSLTWSGRRGAMLKQRLRHYVDRDISDMVRRLDAYATARAKDLRDSGDIGSTANNVRRLFSRFFKCYVRRKGYKEGGYGLIIALFAGLYPLLAHLKAKLEDH
ncbi:glycosyltransferase family 2 protein [Magnetospira sp. QH-2]|uniref:glycosyltransferase family 2 protein n=1 Tax=Magnetospira sp. (strain QH-2) TaxID=1288970 RepID=UPI0003E817CC|nr:glycosyltransferase family 2 protein [Magnetospira sp. QH-2]CCQ73898.1 GT2 : distantly related to LOS b-1, 4-glucosyltransferase [Magnetospira sp. QH-2]